MRLPAVNEVKYCVALILLACPLAVDHGFTTCSPATLDGDVTVLFFHLICCWAPPFTLTSSR